VLTKYNNALIKSSFKVSNTFTKYFFVFILLFCFTKYTSAQKLGNKLTTKNTNPKEFVISYAIKVEGAKKKALQQTYNGGLKTIFVKNNLVRVRLVSLMRMQSLYFNNEKWVKYNKASIVQESGKQKTILNLDAKQWKLFNSKNDSARCDIYVDDTLTILNKLCNKALLTFKDSTNITVYYLPGAKSNTLTASEPIFNTVPGLVMKYIYEVKNKSVSYTAVDLRFEKISNTVFLTPKTGYKKIKYNPYGPLSDVTEDEDDSIEDTGDEDEDAAPVTTPIKTAETASTKGSGGK
jgi:hypothetical protein